MTRWLKRRASLFVAALVFGCSTAHEARAEDTGFEGGIRVGYGIPIGDVGGDQALSDWIAGQIPITLDLGYRVIPNLFVGLYGQYGFGWAGDTSSVPCDVSSQLSCSAHDIRLGVEAHLHFMPHQKLDPWVGLGIGYEWLGVSQSGDGLELSTTVSGVEFFNLQAGLDIQVAEHFYIGPFLNFSVGQYSSVSLDCSGSPQLCVAEFSPSGIRDKALHEWLLIGVRGAYAP